MLVLGVDVGDYIMIGEDIKIRVLKTGGTFRLAIDAPREMLVLREKLIERANPDADDSAFDHLRPARKRRAAAK